MNSLKRRGSVKRFALAATLFLALLSGCSKTTGPAITKVNGTVTLDGEPVNNGEISFQPASGQLSGGSGKIVDGKYSFETPHAEMRVSITAYREIPGKFIEENPGERTPAVEQYVPAQYNNNSELKADVKPGNTTFNFELTSK